MITDIKLNPYIQPIHLTLLPINCKLILTIAYHSYPERWRDWPYEISATAFQKSIVPIPVALAEDKKRIY